jgi:hypothetical protein
MDASDHALGGIIVTLLYNGDGQMPVNMDNWVLDGAGVLPIVCNCAKLQVDNFPTCPLLFKIMIWIWKLYAEHRNLTYAEQAKI